jgi:hypothetical protein
VNRWKQVGEFEMPAEMEKKSKSKNAIKSLYNVGGQGRTSRNNVHAQITKL